MSGAQLPLFGAGEPHHVVGLSGGADSTAMALRLREVYPDRAFVYLITPTGDELPEMLAHWERLEALLGAQLTRITNGTLDLWIERFQALPNHRQRWCTRLLKIRPCLDWLHLHQPAQLYVGLRADEPEREGIYGEVTPAFPLRDWGWGRPEVLAYLARRGVCIPRRTDCARCYGQRIGEWKSLLALHPDIYAAAEAQEEQIGATFRSPGRDTWPAALKDLRLAFESGRKVRGEGRDDEAAACRVCSL